MATWNEFVKEVQKREGCTYKEALKLASPLWKAKKAGKKAEPEPAPKKTRKRKKVQKTKPQPAEQQDFPKVQTKKKREKRVRIPKTEAVPLTNLGGSLIPQDVPTRKPRGRRRLQKKRAVRYDADAMFLKQKLRV